MVELGNNRSSGLPAAVEHYRVHDVLTIRIERPSRALAGDLNRRMGYFLTQEPAVAPDIIVRLGACEALPQDCYSLDHKYHVKKNFIGFRDSDKGLVWDVRIAGLEAGTIEVSFAHAPGNFRKFPWMLFPDMILHLYVLQPLMELVLARKGCYLLHAGAACTEGKAICVAGRGGAFKTSLVMELVRRGYGFMSDDFILLRGEEVRAFPTNVSLFEYSLRAGRENLSLFEQGGYFLSGLRRAGCQTLPVTQSAGLQAMAVLVPVDGGRAAFEELSAAESARALLMNQRLEKRAYVSFNYVIGDFLDAYRMIFPDSGVSNDIVPDEGGLERLLSGRRRCSLRLPAAGLRQQAGPQGDIAAAADYLVS